jgi:hypothetical protein
MGPSPVSTQPESAGPALEEAAPLPDLVRAAGEGAPGAFNELVRRFQDMAVGTA